MHSATDYQIFSPACLTREQQVVGISLKAWT